MKYIKVVALILLSSVSIFCPSLAYSDIAQTSSPDYQLSEVYFGSGGQLNACSTDFCSKQSGGELTVGNSKSTNFQAQGGFNTNRDPYIQMVVSNTTHNLGTITPASTATATASFSISTYLAHGYVVVNGSSPPTNGTYTMNALSTPTASTPGSEQFGINLVANTIPTTFGANPTYTPSSGSFSYGIVDSNYNIPNEFMYSKGSTIALSTQSTSYTNYTISYIFNVSHTTPGGTYTFNHVLIATGTY